MFEAVKKYIQKDLSKKKNNQEENLAIIVSIKK